MNRRDFTALLPAALSAAALMPAEALSAQETAPKPAPALKPGEKPKVLSVLEPGAYPPGELYVQGPGRTSQRFLIGMLVTGNIRLESHVTYIEPGAPHEAVDKHLHGEMWLVREGTVELTINGTPHILNVGDVGLVTAGNEHWVRNAGKTKASYFVVTLGPPE